MKLEVHMLGLDQLEENLVELAKEFGPKNAQSAFNLPLKKATNDLLSQVEASASSDVYETGAGIGTKDRIQLKRSVGRKIRKPPANTLGPHLHKNENVVAQVGYFWKKGTGGRLYYTALRNEFGRSAQGVPGQSTLRKAFSNNKQKMLQTFSKELGGNIKKRGKALGKRKAKSGSKFKVR